MILVVQLFGRADIAVTDPTAGATATVVLAVFAPPLAEELRRRRRGKAGSGNEISFGEFGLQAVGHAWVDSRQIEAARRAMTRSVKRGGKIWIRVFPDKPATKKPAETRMGSGKGSPSITRMMRSTPVLMPS